MEKVECRSIERLNSDRLEAIRNKVKALKSSTLTGRKITALYDGNRRGMIGLAANLVVQGGEG